MQQFFYILFFSQILLKGEPRKNKMLTEEFFSNLFTYTIQYEDFHNFVNLLFLMSFFYFLTDLKIKAVKIPESDQFKFLEYLKPFSKYTKNAFLIS